MSEWWFEGLHVTEREEATGRRLFALAGELDLGSADSLQDQLLTSLTAATALVVDLADVTFIDSTGVRALIKAADCASERGVEYAVRDPQPQALHVIELLGVAHVLGISQQVVRPPNT